MTKIRQLAGRAAKSIGTIGHLIYFAMVAFETAHWYGSAAAVLFVCGVCTHAVGYFDDTDDTE